TSRRHPCAELYPDAAAAHIGPETDALRVHAPKAERARTCAHSVHMRALAVPGGDIPGHHAIGNEAAPLQIAVAALPRVSEQQPRVIEAAAPAQLQPLHGGGRGRQRDPQGSRDVADGYGEIAGLPASACDEPQVLLARGGLHANAVGRPAEIEEPVRRRLRAGDSPPGKRHSDGGDRGATQELATRGHGRTTFSRNTPWS